MELLILAGSLAAVLALAGVARLLGLGGGGIADPDEARRLAEDSFGGFRATQVFVSSDGGAAVVIGAEADAALLKAHGVHVAARRVALPVAAQRTPAGLRIDSGERMFGSVELLLSPEDRDRLLTIL